ncbi:MAG: hypothetical protein FVQ83_08425 [Chloroflexi bacterium]|nr:hypothetical protein [Chloroflexota bacterium]
MEEGTEMRTIWKRIKLFFFPPEDTPRWLRLLPYAILGVLTLLVLSGGVSVWTYTNSPEFCGTTCHTMPPEYSAYLSSPHARVNCVECHLGRDTLTTQFTRKAGDMKHVIATITQNYEFPIFSEAMRPARESCETCHFPEKFSDDSLREIRRFSSDEQNSPTSLYLLMKTGGGTQREGLGRGIHWHIENEVLFLPTDSLEQEIPYVRVTEEDGEFSEYYDIASGLTPDDIAGETLVRMDCITCHNRITHSIPNPVDAVDQALAKTLISPELPFIREQSVQLLGDSYLDLQDALESIAGLEDYYRGNYPQIFEENIESIHLAILSLQDIYMQMVFPEQELDWTTHPDNLGHKNSPGCFRCHDGKHLSPEDEAIRLECNVCHSVPVVSQETASVTQIEITTGPEPVSHTHTSWIALHGGSIDLSCAVCHEPVDPEVDYLTLEGIPPTDQSFCGNSACHVSEWTFIGFDDPAMIPILESQLYELLNTSPYLFEGVQRTYDATFKSIFDGRCSFCHNIDNAEAGLVLTSYESILQGGANGAVLIPGDPDASLIIERQSNQRGHFGQMLEDELNALRAWILAGAPEN